MGYGNWVYDAGPPPTITIVADATQGINWTTAFNFLDIALAIVDQGWGAVDWSEQCAKQFCSGVRIQIGDGVTDTYFSDKGCSLLFKDGITTANYQPLFYVSGTGKVVLGKMYNAARKTTIEGCFFIDLEDSRYQTMFSTAVGGETDIYGCTFVFSIVIDRSRWKNGNIWNCNFTCITSAGTSVTFDSCDVYNCYVAAGFEGFSTPTNCTISDVKIKDSPCRLVISTGAAIDFQNTDFNNATLQLDSRWSNATFTNCTHSNWSQLTWYSTSSGITRRRNTIDLRVTDDNGIPIEGATVTLLDKDDNEVFAVETDENGDIPTQTVNYAYATYANGTTWTTYGPFTMTISKAGSTYLTQVHKLDIDEKTKEQISMTDVSDLVDGINDIKGTGFTKDTHSLTDIKADTDKIKVLEDDKEVLLT